MSIFALRAPADLASALQGRELELPNGEVVIITKPVPYPKSKNDTPSYRRIFDMQPGEVYTPTVMSPVFLIVCFDGQEIGGCVRIKGIEADVGMIDAVGKYIGFQHRAEGRIIEREGKPLLLEINCDLTPGEVTVKSKKSPTAPKKKKAEGPLSDDKLAPFMSALAARYAENAGDDDSFDIWLTAARTQYNTPGKMRRFLGL